MRSAISLHCYLSSNAQHEASVAIATPGDSTRPRSIVLEPQGLAGGDCLEKSQFPNKLYRSIVYQAEEAPHD